MILNKNLVPEKYYSEEGEKIPNKAQERKNFTKIKTFNILQQFILERRWQTLQVHHQERKINYDLFIQVWWYERNKERIIQEEITSSELLIL